MISSYEDYKNASNDEKEEYIFFQISEAIEKKDYKQFQRAQELQFWETINRLLEETVKKPG